MKISVLTGGFPVMQIIRYGWLLNFDVPKIDAFCKFTEYQIYNNAPQ